VKSILKINAPSVVSEVIDGEAVIMDLASGHYFSTQHVGCDIWRGINEEGTRSAIVRSLIAIYAVDASEARRAVDTFVSDLLERKLVVEMDGDGSGSEVGIETPAQASVPLKEFTEPVLNAYADMQDLLLLDPIHDVDETGWPMPKPPQAGP
jgi:Coenzyme PQQ synthesis protein D (PqqD)